MCARVPNLEWSGVLFYTTEGEFGEENFKVTAEEVYLMDIGTSSFTGYDYEPDLIEYMMKNPKLMDMHKGHIHSHNTMPVFFSGTDTAEIHDNSEFHNYYLSLIVNNKNEMTAKIAFRGTRKIESVSHISFKGDNGAVKNGTFSDTREQEVVYVYDCDIIHSADEVLAAKADALIKARTATNPSKMVHTPTYNGEQSKKSWKDQQIEADWDDYNKKSKDKQVELEFDPAPSFYWEDDGVAQVVEKKSKKERKSDSPGSARVENFISKVIIGDFLHEEALKSTLGRFKTMSAKEITGLCERIEKRMFNFYIDCFPEDQNLKSFNGVMTTCCERISELDDVYPELCDKLWEVFNIEI